jgi:hypothetical protein
VPVTHNEETEFWGALQTRVRNRVDEHRADGLEYDGILFGTIIPRKPRYPAITHRVIRHPFEYRIECSLETTENAESGTNIARATNFVLTKHNDTILAINQDDINQRLNLDQMVDYIMEPFGVFQ